MGRITGRGRGYAKERNSNVIGFLILGFIFLIGLVAVLQFTGTFSFLSIYGGNIISISEVQVLDSGQRLLISATVGGAENLLIDFNNEKSEINSQIEGGYEVTDLATMEISMQDPSREYSASKTTKDFFTIDTYELGYWAMITGCNRNIPAGVTGDVFRMSVGKCGYKVSEGTYATFTGSVIDDTEVQFKLDGDLIGSLNPSTGNNVVRNGQTSIEWVGNLMNFETLETPYSYALLFKGSNYDKIIDVTSWNSFENKVSNYGTCLGYSGRLQPTFKDLFLNIFRSDSVATNCLNTFNNGVNDVLDKKNTEYKNSVNIQNYYLTSNGLKVFLNAPSVFPTFKMYLDARFVVIQELMGKPKITNCGDLDRDIDSGEKYNMNVEVQNVGENTGTFFGSVVCSGSSSISNRAFSKQTVLKDSFATFTTQMSGINAISGEQDNTCKITIEDLKSGETDTCNFDLGVSYEKDQICTPGEVECKNSLRLWECNADGTAHINEELCPRGCVVLTDGNSQCRTSICVTNTDCKGGEECINGFCVIEDKDSWWDKLIGWFTDLFSGVIDFFMMVKYVAVALGGFIAFSLSKDLLEDKTRFEKGVITGISLALGLVVAFLLINFIYAPLFWVILVAVLIFKFFGVGKLIPRR